MKSIYANGKRGRTAELLNRINFAMFKTFAVYMRACTDGTNISKILLLFLILRVFVGMYER